MSDNVRVNQHYLPRFYLKGFEAKDIPGGPTGHVWLFERPDPLLLSHHKRIEPKWKPKGFKVTASEDFHYAITRPDGSLDNHVEHDLDKLENRMGPVLEVIRSGGDLTEQERLIFARFVMMMLARVPNRTGTVKAFVDGVEKWRHRLRSQYWKTNDDPVAQAAFRHHYPDGRPPPPSSAGEALDASLPAFLETGARSLLNMCWIFGRAAENSFVTSDDPVVLHNIPGSLFQFGAGCLWRGSIHMPVSAHIDFSASYDGPPGYSWIELSDVHAAAGNRLYGCAARKFLIASSRTFPGSDGSLNDFYPGVPASL